MPAPLMEETAAKRGIATALTVVNQPAHIQIGSSQDQCTDAREATAQIGVETGEQAAVSLIQGCQKTGGVNPPRS